MTKFHWKIKFPKLQTKLCSQDKNINKKHIIAKQGKYQIYFPSNISIYLKFLWLNPEHKWPALYFLKKPIKHVSVNSHILRDFLRMLSEHTPFPLYLNSLREMLIEPVVLHSQWHTASLAFYKVCCQGIWECISHLRSRMSATNLCQQEARLGWIRWRKGCGMIWKVSSTNSKKPLKDSLGRFLTWSRIFTQKNNLTL